MGEFAMPQVTLEFALTQPAAIVEYCKQLMDSVKMLERQVQGLVRDDRASKSAEKNRKEKQWQLERERLLFDLEVANHGLVEKEESLNKLEKDFQIAKSAAGQLQNKLHESERKRERDLLENDRLKGAIEDAQRTIDELQKSCSLKDEAAAIQRKAFSDLSKRMDSHKKELEKTSEELGQKEGQLADLKLENESTRRKLEEKNNFFDSLKQDYDKLRLAHQGMQSEGMMDREDVLRNLEENEALCEEQACTIRKLEKELRKMKSQAKQMETKCSSAEAEVNAKTALLSKALADLEASSLSVTELASAKEAAVVLAEKMMEFEKELIQERALRDSAERALQDFKIRESHLLRVEENFNDLLEKAKWKDEQFGSLEEAHRKLQIQLKVSESEWDNERAQMVREIDSLRDGLEAKAKLAQHLNSQLDMLQQALDHEHLHQTDLERGMADAKASMNLAEREFEKARLAFDIVREELAAKATLLDEYAARMEWEPTGLGSWQKDTVQDDGTLECLHSDSRGARTSMELQEPLNESPDVQKNPDSTELATKFNKTEIAWDEEKERVHRFVRDVETCLACKGVRLIELGVEVGESRSLVNALSDLEAKSCVSGLNKLNISNSKNPGESLEVEDTVLRSLTDKRREIYVPPQIEQVNQNQEVLVAQEASMLEIKRLKEQVSEMVDLHAQKQNLIKQRDLDLKKLQAAHDKALAQFRLNEKTLHDEKDKLISELDAYEFKELENERQKKETQTNVERLEGVISKLEAQISSMKKDIVDQSLLAELAKDHLSTGILEVERLKAESHLLSETFAASMAAKDATLEQLRQHVLELDDICAGLKEAVNRETSQSKSLEGQLKMKQELQRVLEHRICDLNIELDKSTKETERLSQVELLLLNRIHQLEDESELNKGACEGQLESLNAQLSRCQDNLHEVAEELERMSTERDALLSNLSSMEAEKAELREENQALLRDKLLLQSTLNLFEAKQLELIKELEVSETTMAKLCATHEEAEAGLASKSEELQEMNWKLSNVETLKLHLQIAQEKNQEMEEILSETRATVEEKEERLAASEWAVQQLASEIAKAKHSLKQKEREESFLQARLSDLEIHLRDKEREMEEMEMYLNAIMQSNEEKQADIDTLTLKMRDLKKGADEWKLREIDLETELYDLRNSLEESEEALEKIKAEVQLGLQERKSMEDAIDSLKKQLSDKGLGCSDRQFEMDQLCHDLESAQEAATQSSSQLQDLQQRLPQLEQSCADRIRKEKSEFDEVVQELQIIQIKLQSCEVNLESTRADLSQYKEKCDSLVEAVVEKDSIIEDLKGMLASARYDSAHQTTLVQQASRERLRALKDLDNKTEILKKLEVSAAKTDSTLGNMELNKEKLEQEVKRLKKSLENLRKESASNAHEAERFKCKVEELQEITDQYSDAQVLISQLTNELQVTSSTVEERDSRLLKLQASLTSLQDELRMTQDMLAEKECHREHLDVQLTMMKSQMEKNEAEILQMQDALKLAESELQTAGDSVLRYVQDLQNLQAALDVSQAQVASLSEEGFKRKLETESSIKELQLELSVWVERAENLTTKNMKLDSAMQKLQCELERWRESADVAACEGRTAREQIGTAVNGLYKELEDFCQHLVIVEGEGIDKFAELEARLQIAFEELKSLHMSTEVASAKKVELLSSTIKLLFVGLRGWRNELRSSVENDQLARKELYISISDLKLEVELWKSRATAAEDAVEGVRVEFVDLLKELQKEVDLWKSRTEHCNTSKLDLERSVECLQRELAEWKAKTVAAVDEERRVKMTHEANLVELQQELEVWKGKCDSVVEVLNHQKLVYATSLNDIQTELKDWMNKASTANLEADKSATEVKLYQGKASAVADEMKQVQSQLQQALSAVVDLKLQLEHEKNKVTTTEMVTQQLQHDLTIAQEEATSRKAKMSHILSQLESAHASQKSLQKLLRMQHERLLQDNDLASSNGACSEVNHRDIASTLQDLSLKDMVIQDLRSKLSVSKSAITRLESERLGSETVTQSAELLHTQDQQSNSGAGKTHFRMGFGDVQLAHLHTSGSHSHRAGNSTLLSSNHSPKAPTTRRRNVSPRVHVSKSASRISFTDSSSCNVLSEANENSLAYGPRSFAPLTTSRKSRDNQSTPFMGSLL